MSDHKDANLAVENPECDIGDIWVFHRGRGHDARVVFAMSVNAGEVGLTHYGPRGDRNAEVYTTVPKRFLKYTKRNRTDEFDGLLKRGDHRYNLTKHLCFSESAVYEFRIAKPVPGDPEEAFAPALSFKVTFSGQGGVPPGETQPVAQRMKLLVADASDGDHIERGDRSGAEVPLFTAGSPGASSSVMADVGIATDADARIQLFAGPRQDAFYFDFAGVKSLVAQQYRQELCHGGAPSGGSSQAFSQAYNISAIVLEVPIQMILSDDEIDGKTTFHAWGATTLDGHPIDRAGWPLFNPTFLPKSRFESVLDSFNETRYGQQHDLFADLLIENFLWLDIPKRRHPALVDRFLPDALPIDVSRAPGLEQRRPNGRLLDRDDPSHYYVELLDNGAYEKRRKRHSAESPVKTTDHFPYMSPPSRHDRQVKGWTYEPDIPKPDPAWPSPSSDWQGHPASCDLYLDQLEDPTHVQDEDWVRPLTGHAHVTSGPKSVFLPGRR